MSARDTFQLTLIYGTQKVDSVDGLIFTESSQKKTRAWIIVVVSCFE